VGLTGLEPVTLRLSSACSNQLSYKPVLGRYLEVLGLRNPNTVLRNFELCDEAKMLCIVPVISP
jgi:hypothetical protein